MIAVLALHAVLGVAAIVAGERLQRRALYVAGLGPLVALFWLVAQYDEVVGGTPVAESVAWVPTLGLDLDASDR